MQYLNTSPPTGSEEEGPKPVDERVVAHIPRLSDEALLATFEEWPYGPYTRELISRYKFTCGMFDAQEALLTKIAKKYPKIWEEFAP